MCQEMSQISPTTMLVEPKSMAESVQGSAEARSARTGATAAGAMDSKAFLLKGRALSEILRKVRRES
jgi:hypothetical protein